MHRIDRKCRYHGKNPKLNKITVRQKRPRYLVLNKLTGDELEKGGFNSVTYKYWRVHLVVGMPGLDRVKGLNNSNRKTADHFIILN